MIANGAMFADFLYGGHREQQRQVKRLGRVWAAAWRKDRAFPEPSVSPVPSGALVVTVEVADFERLDPLATRWRLYFVQNLAGAITEHLDPNEWDVARVAFETHTLRYSWGALDAAIEHSSPNSLDSVARRIESVLQWWGQLDGLRYLDNKRQELGLGALMERHFRDFVGLWLTHGSGDIKRDISSALAAARAATPEVVSAAVASRVASIARFDDRVKHRVRLAESREILELLASLDDLGRREMETGYGPALRRQLYIWDEDPDLWV